MKCERCDNTARYTTVQGNRVCSLCAMRNHGGPHVRDMDVPAVLAKLESLLDTLDGQLVTIGYSTRSELRVLIASKPVLKQEEPI